MNTLVLNQILFQLLVSPIRFAVSRKMLVLIVISSILSLVVFSVLQLNGYTKDIYTIQDYEKQLRNLTQEQKSMEVNLSKVNSLENISAYVQNFEKVDRVEYIRVLESTALAK